MGLYQIAAVPFPKELCVRLAVLLRRFEPDTYLSVEMLRAHRRSPPALGEGASALMEELFGHVVAPELRSEPARGLQVEPAPVVMEYLCCCWQHLKNIEAAPEYSATKVLPDLFEDEVNRILGEHGIAGRLKLGRIVEPIESEVEALYAVLLSAEDESASCTKGDVQVEMVASSVQGLLSRSGALLVDYGFGMGRVLAGLSTATLFRQVNYVGVDSEVPDVLRSEVVGLGAAPRFMEREEFLGSGLLADVIMVVNTLHHVPFKDVPRQVASLLRHLAPGGDLLIHEMGRLPEPERLNVPWTDGDIEELFRGIAPHSNIRPTMSRRGIPLTNALIRPDPALRSDQYESILREAVAQVWRGMKERALSTIRSLYGSRAPDRWKELHEAMITNANLDLNVP